MMPAFLRGRKFCRDAINRFSTVAQPGNVVEPVIIVFHTVLLHPEPSLKIYLQWVIAHCASVIVMTQISSRILQQDYRIKEDKISIIPHGTHLVLHSDKKTSTVSYLMARLYLI
jgi:hypothetical protein